MLKNIKITSASVIKRVGVFVLDFISLIALYIGLYFAFTYLIFDNAYSYTENINYISTLETSLNLNYRESEDFEVYKEVIDEFYFDIFENQIVNRYNEVNNVNYTIEHIYNIQVLSLPSTPNATYHSNEMFTYIQNSDGTYNVDVVGEVLDGLGGYNHDRNMSDYFYYKYESLNDIVKLFDNQYAHALSDKAICESISRVSAFGLGVVILYLVFPLTNKYGSTIFESIFHLAHVHNETGFVAKKYKIVLRPFIYYLIPTIFILFAANPMFYALVVFYIFISLIMLLISENHLDLADKILCITTVDESDSLIFDNVEEEEAYALSEEYNKIEDQEFLDRLSNIKSIDVSTNRDAHIKQESKKEIEK